MTPQAAGIMVIGVAIRPRMRGTTYGILSKNKIGTANTTYPYFPENLAIKQYKITISSATKIAKSGEDTYTCTKETNAPNNTKITGGVKVPKNASKSSAGRLIKCCSCPMALLIQRNTTNAITNLSNGSSTIWNFCKNGLGRKALYDAAAKRYGKTFGLDLIGRTLDTFLYRLVSQAFKRNCAPDGVKVFSFDFSKESWWIPSDLPTGIL